ncbi:hypothetical protein RYH80_18710 [Halobaculum sp. MBLA0147]|uniref:hypothetical protein n=1 Tax=Halobaculum sp. MBLA0147 TaxID=3079934 RepID=UPI003524EA5A
MSHDTHPIVRRMKHAVSPRAVTTWAQTLVIAAGVLIAIDPALAAAGFIENLRQTLNTWESWASILLASLLTFGSLVSGGKDLVSIMLSSEGGQDPIQAMGKLTFGILLAAVISKWPTISDRIEQSVALNNASGAIMPVNEELITVVTTFL